MSENMTVGKEFFVLLDLVKNSSKYEKRMADLKAQEDSALKALGGQKKLDEIELKHAQAQKTLDDAFHKLKNAESDGESIIENARISADKIVNEAEQRKSSYAAWANKESARLTDLKAVLDSKAAAIGVKEAELKGAQAEAEKTMREAKALKQKLDMRIGELAAVGVKVA